MNNVMTGILFHMMGVQVLVRRKEAINVSASLPDACQYVGMASSPSMKYVMMVIKKVEMGVQVSVRKSQAIFVGVNLPCATGSPTNPDYLLIISLIVFGNLFRNYR